MPRSIVKRPNDILGLLEAGQAKEGLSKGVSAVGKGYEGVQLSFFQLDDPILSQIRDEILQLDVNNLTPLEALNKLSEIKRIVKGK